MSDDRETGVDMGALLLAEVAREDPLTRFVASLPNEPPYRLRAYYEDTIRIRREFEENARTLLIGNYQEACGAASWMRANAHEVAHRWCTLRSTAIEWAKRDVSSLIFRIPR